jgi:uncharacterized membrane protein
MKQRSVDIFAVIAITLIAIILAFVMPQDNVAARIWTLPLVLFLPGYALISALFTKERLGVAERFVFSLGLSLSIAIPGGLLLNLTSFGLRSGSWAVLLGGITIAASVFALIRRRGQASFASGRPWVIGFTFRQGLLLGLALIVVGGAIAVSIIGAQQQPYPGFTQFWILPAGQANTRNVVHLGVKNMEPTPMVYRLVVNINNKPLKIWPAIDVNQSDTWEATLVLPQSAKGSSTKVEAKLYREDAPTKVYRDVFLWLGT